MSRRPPFKQVEASRPDFRPEAEFEYTKVPDPSWAPGQGANSVVPNRPTATDAFTTIDPATRDAGDVYKLMISAITPRPIAFVSSISDKGVANLAPFSYFSTCGHNPPMIAVSFSTKAGDLKDTASNILHQKEFVVNIISEQILEAANYTCIDAPANVSEWDLSGLTPVPSETIKPARVAESPFAMECTLEHSYEMKTDDGTPTGLHVLGRVRRFHVRSSVLAEDGSTIADIAKLRPVSRLGGITYGRTIEGSELPRPVWEKEKERAEVKGALEGAAGTA